MNRQLRKLQVTAADIGHCVVCGGVNGNCNCVPTLGSALQSDRWPDFSDIRSFGNSTSSDCYLCCKHCRRITLVSADINVVRCECGCILKHVYTEPLIPEPDYSLVEDTTTLPKRALRQPKYLRDRK